MKKLLIAIVAIPLVLVLFVMLVIGGISTGIIGGNAPSNDARRDIPGGYLAMYQRSADACPGLPWAVVAAIGKVETNHGRLQAPGVTSGANFAGAAGPMQMGIGVGAAGDAFWRFAIDGDGDGRASPYDPADGSRCRPAPRRPTPSTPPSSSPSTSSASPTSGERPARTASTTAPG